MTVEYLIMAETRLGSVSRYFPGSSEETRLKNVVSTMLNELTDQERSVYEAKKRGVETKEEKSERLRLEVLAMEANKDSNSI